MALIIAEPEWCNGRVRHAHYEIELEGEELSDFEALSEEERTEYILEVGLLIVDDVSMTDFGKMKKCVIHK